MAPAQTSLLAKLDTQERVRDFLTNAVASGRASHAYLFLGAPGAGKLDAAELDDYCATFYADDNHEHMVFPGLV